MHLRLAAALAASCLFATAGCSRSTSESASPQARPSPETVEAAAGKRLFSACQICHIAAAPGTPGAKQMSIGPNLWGVYGRASASTDFAYSPAMQKADLVWNDETLNAFIENPMKYMPGTRMSFAGEADPQKRQEIIDYLKTLK